MNNKNHKMSNHLEAVVKKLQFEVDSILVDISDYIIERSEDGDIHATAHFDVDMILSSQRIPNRVGRRSRAHERAHRQSHIVNRHGVLGNKYSIPEYNSEFLNDTNTNDRRPFGKLNTAARFMFGHM